MAISAAAASFSSTGDLNCQNPAKAKTQVGYLLLLEIIRLGTGATTDGDGAFATAARNSATQIRNGQTPSGVRVAAGIRFSSRRKLRWGRDYVG